MIATFDPKSILIQLRYHGFRYHGWVMQKNLPTIEETFRTTWLKVFQYPIRAFAISRTDAHVHAYDQWVKVMSKEDIIFTQDHLNTLNAHLPSDIRALSFQKAKVGFNIIGAAQKKEYRYYFANDLPSNIPLAEEKILHFIEPLNFLMMQEAASCFLGTHSFRNYQRREKETANFNREVLSSTLSLMNDWEGLKLDKCIYCYSVEAKGFLRQMVRIMVGTILNVGQGKVSIDEVRASLKGDTKVHVGFVSPGYGLFLNKVTF